MLSVNKRIGNRRVTFTPSFFKRAYLSYKNGSHRELIAMMKESRTDSMVSGCLQGRKAGFMRELQIEPFDNENSQDQERAEFYKEIFSRLQTRSLFKDIMQARLYKYSVIDFEWAILDGRQVPTRHKFFEQKYFQYDTNGDGQLKIDNSNNLEEIPPEALVCESDDIPVMLPVLRDFILKEFGLEAWASFLENFGEGMVIGYYPPGSGTDVKDALEDAVNTIAGSSRGTAPKGTEINIIESAKNSGDHENFKNAADDGISISILGHANAAKQSGAQIGENTAPFKPMQHISIDDLYYVDECLDQLVKTIHDRNFGDSRYPSIKTSKPDQIGMKERRENLRLAWDMGFAIDPNDVRKLGIEVQQDAEPQQKTDPFQY